ncbi:hypothetical protein GF312_21445 [Candidatus Poribacteria bacterium]|nr:hypothetical protein [Candidatus Poribacteria bacterium]
MAELIVTRLDPVTNQWEHNHAEGKTGTKEEGEKWLSSLKDGEIPEGKRFEWDEVIDINDKWVEVSNLHFGPYEGPDAGKLIHSLKKARLTVAF